jgi:mannose-1-phosphate guanylyltransferase
MEKEPDVWTVPGTFPWSDVGGWRAACDLVPADGQGNQIRGPVILENVAGSLVITDPGHPVIVVGVEDCIVVHGKEGTLVCRKDMVDRLKLLVERSG